MDPIGYDGLFKKSMICTFEALCENVPIICDYCEVFVDDPLLDWIWSNRKNTSQAVKHNSDFSNSQEPPEKAFFSEKIGSVKKKLEGFNPRYLLDQCLQNSRHRHANFYKELIDVIWSSAKNKEKKLSTADVVEELISLATDKNVLGRTYIGWNPYV